MDYWVLYILSLLAAGLASGFVAGLFGVGGGIVRIPMFLFLFPILGIEPDVLMHVAAGTSLALAIPSSIMASRAQYKAGKLDMGFLKSWIPALVIGVIVGIFVMRFVSSRFLEQVFAFVILFSVLWVSRSVFAVVGSGACCLGSWGIDGGREAE